jgi:hypothetical protein
MSTVAGKCTTRRAADGRVVRMACALALCAGLAGATASFAPPCEAQSTPPQNNATPPATTDDPPPSLIKHPAPPPTPPPQTTTPAAPGTTAPSSSSSATVPAERNPAPVQSSAAPATSSSASPAAAGDAPTNDIQSSNSGQSSTGAQSPAPQAAATSQASPAVVPVSDAAASAPEINTRTTTVPLESRVNLVPVRVVVHDSTGRAVENLRKEDFQIKQDGQLQFITHFSTEIAGSTDKQVVRGEAIPLPTDSTSVTESAPGASAKTVAAPPGALTMPTRFVALLFDDVHLDVGDVARTRTAAMRFIETTVKPNERLAIYTISGQHQVDFTDDRAAIRASLIALMANPVGAYDPKTQRI